MKKIQFVILLTQLLLIPIFCFSESAKERSPEEELPAEMALTEEKAAFFVSQKAFAEYYYDVAVRALSTFVELFPASENACDAYLLLGQACFQLKRYDAAQAALRKAAEAKNSGKFSDALSFWMAKCDLARGLTDRALPVFATLTRSAPASRYQLHSLYNMSLCYEANEEYEKAIQQLQLVRKADSESRLFFPCALHEARCLIALRRTPEAQKLLLASIENKSKDPCVSESFFLLGEIATSLGDHQSSYRYYQKSLSGSMPQEWHPEAYYGIGWCLLKLRRYDEALKVLEDIEKLRPQPGLVKKVEMTGCRLRLLKGEGDAAIAALEEYMKRYPADPTIAEAKYLVAEALLNLKKYKAALKQYDNVISSFPKAPLLDKVYFGKGRALFLSGNYLESVKSFRKVGELSKDARLQLEADRSIAEALYTAADYGGAAAAYREVLEKTPPSANPDEILFRLGWSYYRQGEYDSAIASLETLVTKFPKSEYADNALYRVGGAYCRKGDYEKAVGEYDRLEKDYPKSDLLDSVKYQIGLCNYNIGRYYPALVAFREVVEKFPKSPLGERCSYEIGWCHHQLGKEEDALKHFRAHIAKYGRTELSGEALFWLGEFHYNRANYDAALESFRRLAEQYPAHNLADRALYWKGRSALNLAKYKDAVEAFSKLAQLFPESSLRAEALYHLAIAYKEQKLFSPALLAFEKVNELHPKTYLRDDLTWQIADCLLAMGRRGEALSTYTKLLRSETPSTRARGRYGRGRCFQDDGRYSSAIAELMVVIWEFPEEKELVGQAAFAAAQCYEELGQRHNAIRVYSLIVEGDLQGKQKAEKAIQSLRKRSLFFFIKQR